MSKSSNNQGRAYEFACLQTLNDELNKIREAEIIVNSSFVAAERAWQSISEELRTTLVVSANATVRKIFELEPNLTEQTDDIVQMYLQKDEKGESGDVRDIVVKRDDICWEIGLSIKHNHRAVKHSRLSPTVDFGEKWYGFKCSQDYWEKANTVFKYLDEEHKKGTLFEDIPNKDDALYVPLLQAFIDEVKTQFALHHDLPRRMVEYLLGTFDFYKVVSVDSKRQTDIETYNIHGHLNKPSKTVNSAYVVPLVKLPTRLVAIEFKPKSKTTVELYFDEGWQFSFRMHNAEKVAVHTLKFDIHIVGVPSTILNITCNW